MKYVEQYHMLILPSGERRDRSFADIQPRINGARMQPEGLKREEALELVNKWNSEAPFYFDRGHKQYVYWID